MTLLNRKHLDRAALLKTAYLLIHTLDFHRFLFLTCFFLPENPTCFFMFKKKNLQDSKQQKMGSSFNGDCHRRIAFSPTSWWLPKALNLGSGGPYGFPKRKKNKKRFLSIKQPFFLEIPLVFSFFI